MLHIYAAVAQKERRLIAARTREALQATKRRGATLGKTGKDHARENKAAAKALARTLEPILRKFKAEGVTSIRATMTELDRRNVPSACGGVWHVTSVARLLARLT
jgi:DNA invertase Pin-like site-specific DNA recombinase